MNIVKVTKNPEEANAITHGGYFHADEVFATAILSLIMDVRLMRVFKVPKKINDNIIVYDIGYGRFDHHQKGGNGERFNGVPYSSAGLIWKKYGMQVLEKVLNAKDVFKLVDILLIQPIDAHDNGYTKLDSIGIPEMNVSKLIAFCNPTWDSKVTSDDAFVEAVEMAEKILLKVIDTATATVKARNVIEKYIEKAEEGIMVMEQFVPWQDAFFKSKNPKKDTIFVVVYPSNRGGYNWQCVPTILNGHEMKKKCPEEWKGLQDEELSEISGIEKSKFCHNAGFIGGATTLEAALKMAKIIVEGKKE